MVVFNPNLLTDLSVNQALIYSLILSGGQVNRVWHGSLNFINTYFKNKISISEVRKHLIKLERLKLIRLHDDIKAITAGYTMEIEIL